MASSSANATPSKPPSMAPTNDPKTDNCVICYDVLCERDHVELKCHHIFHHDCAWQHAHSLSATCPLCRAELAVINYFDTAGHSKSLDSTPWPAFLESRAERRRQVDLGLPNLLMQMLFFGAAMPPSFLIRESDSNDGAPHLVMAFQGHGPDAEAESTTPSATQQRISRLRNRIRENSREAQARMFARRNASAPRRFSRSTPASNPSAQAEAESQVGMPSIPAIEGRFDFASFLRNALADRLPSPDQRSSSATTATTPPTTTPIGGVTSTATAAAAAASSSSSSSSTTTMTTTNAEPFSPNETRVRLRITRRRSLRHRPHHQPPERPSTSRLTSPRPATRSGLTAQGGVQALSSSPASTVRELPFAPFAPLEPRFASVEAALPSQRPEAPAPLLEDPFLRAPSPPNFLFTLSTTNDYHSNDLFCASTPFTAMSGGVHEASEASSDSGERLAKRRHPSVDSTSMTSGNEARIATSPSTGTPAPRRVCRLDASMDEELRALVEAEVAAFRRERSMVDAPKHPRASETEPKATPTPSFAAKADTEQRVIDIEPRFFGYVCGPRRSHLERWQTAYPDVRVDAPKGYDDQTSFLVLTGMTHQLNALEAEIQAKVEKYVPRQMLKSVCCGKESEWPLLKWMTHGGVCRARHTAQRQRSRICKSFLQSTSTSHLVVDWTNLEVGTKMDTGYKGLHHQDHRVIWSALAEALLTAHPGGFQTACAVGSQMAFRYQDELRDYGVDVVSERRQQGQGEADVDDLLHGHILSLCDCGVAGVAGWLVLVSGDGNDNRAGQGSSFAQVVDRLLEAGWSVDLWAWRASCSARLLARLTASGK
ncbi:uncharacterized protein MONBRDRAFT_11303, partial [Monosiga brevicollis MX1]